MQPRMTSTSQSAGRTLQNPRAGLGGQVGRAVRASAVDDEHLCARHVG